MLAGQEKRLSQGAKPWACPVKADALAARYRVWRERNEAPGTWFQGYEAAPEESNGGEVPLPRAGVTGLRAL